MPESVTSNGMKIEYKADHRNGICIDCNTQMEIVDKVLANGKTAKRVKCPKCDGETGHLIARVISIQPPKPPQCLSFRCLAKFMYDSLYVAFLSSYHRRRVYYAEHNRHKEILERYRTGEPSPKNLWQAIHANIKLTCPVCRRYDIDPLLFSK